MTETDLGTLCHLLSLCFQYPDSTIVGPLRSAIGDLSIDVWQPAALWQGLSPLTALMHELAKLDSEGCEALQREYVRLFAGGDPASTCSLYERSYRDDVEAKQIPQAVRDVYTVWGIQVPLSRADRLDVELEFMAFLCREARRRTSAQTVYRARRRFCREHLSVWLPQFAAMVVACAEHGFYLTAGRLLGQVVQGEMAEMHLSDESGQQGA